MAAGDDDGVRRERLAGLGGGQAGVWARSAALEALTDDQVRQRVRAGMWRNVLPGIYVDAGFDLDLERSAWAVMLAAGKDAVVCGRTAARLWGLPLIDDNDPATQAFQWSEHDVATRRHATSPVRRDGLTVCRRQLALREDDVVQHPTGLVLTTPVRTIRDLAAIVTREALVCVIDQALRQRVVTVGQLDEEAARAKGSRQGPRLREAIAVADGVAESPAETLARLLLKPHLPTLRPQVKVHDPVGNLVAVLDFAVDELKLAVEVDGKRNHAGDVMVAKDRRRDATTKPFGWTTERVSWWEERCRPVAFVSRVLQRAAELRRQAA
jgi:very-short-patch-repair endonuclease